MSENKTRRNNPGAAIGSASGGFATGGSVAAYSRCTYSACGPSGPSSLSGVNDLRGQFLDIFGEAKIHTESNLKIIEQMIGLYLSHMDIKPDALDKKEKKHIKKMVNFTMNIGMPTKEESAIIIQSKYSKKGDFEKTMVFMNHTQVPHLKPSSTKKYYIALFLDGKDYANSELIDEAECRNYLFNLLMLHPHDIFQKYNEEDILNYGRDYGIPFVKTDEYKFCAFL